MCLGGGVEGSSGEFTSCSCPTTGERHPTQGGGTGERRGGQEGGGKEKGREGKGGERKGKEGRGEKKRGEEGKEKEGRGGSKKDKNVD